MTHVATTVPSRSARQVNRSLRWLFFMLWFVVAFHAVILRRHELWPHGAVVIGIGLVPPVLPIVAAIWGKVGLAFFTVLLTALATWAWVAAVRNPGEGFILFLARVGLCVYWLALSFLIALGT